MSFVAHRSVLGANGYAVWYRRAAVVVLTVILGLLSLRLFGSALTDAFQWAAQVTIGSAEFGHGGHADFLPARRVGEFERATERDETWDARVVLRIDGVPQEHTISINPRRLYFLPLLFFTALVAAFPLERRRKMRVMLIGTVLLLGAALGSVRIMLTWLFARVPGLVYDFSSWHEAALQMSYEGLVTSMVNKYVIALVVTFILLYWQTYEQQRPAPDAPTISVTRSKPKVHAASKRTRKHGRRG